jgi:hypothetical protein
MPCLPISYSTLDSVSATCDPSKPIYMLNMWKFRENAAYAPEHSHLSPSPCTGREALDRYRAALYPLLPPNTRVEFKSIPIAHVIAPEGETWDFAAINRYETLDGFKKMVESKEYREGAMPHREAGLENMRLIMLEKLD